MVADRKPGAISKNLIEFVDNPALAARSVAVDGAAHLRGLTDRGSLDFTFEFLGFEFAVHAETGESDGSLRIFANLGHLPYTAESPYLRVNMRAIVAAAASVLDGRLRIASDQRILLTDDRHFDDPLTPASLLANTTGMLIEARPYIELLAAIGGPRRTV
jgi:hypothetical protein